MGHPDGAHTHGSGLGTAVLVLIGAALAVKAAPAVLSAPAELLHALIIMTAVIVGVGAAGLVGLLTWRWHRTRLAAARAMPRFLRSWRGPLSRSHSRGPRSNGHRRYTCACTGSRPRT